MRLYTIGFTKKSAKDFFELLDKNNVKTLFDVRLNNSSQLAGFTKGRDLKFFLKEINNINYYHNTTFSPTKEILKDFKNKKISWDEYVDKFDVLLNQRQIKQILDKEFNKDFDGVCLLCSEFKADNCHRRLVAEKIKELYPNLDIEIIHL